jgi:hypothetical protein
MTDRAALVSLCRTVVDVRRLMYQTLICLVVGMDGRANQPRRLASPLYAQLFQGAADPLVHGMRADAQPGRDFLAAVMLVDKQEAVDLALTEACDTRHRIDPAVHIFSLA